jgi:hypothetical protein
MLRRRSAAVPINIADKIISLITSMQPEAIASLPPADCRHVVALAELKQEPKAGVIGDLRDGRGRE